MEFLLGIVVVAVVIWLLNSSGNSKHHREKNPDDKEENPDNWIQADIDAFFLNERQRERILIEQENMARARREIEAELDQTSSAHDELPIISEDLHFHGGGTEIEGLSGPWPLDSTSIERRFQLPSPGHYAVGSLAGDRTLLVHAIGRSDTDVGSELRQKIDLHSHFMVKLDTNAYAAFISECELFHRFGRKIGMRHPLRKRGELWSCPRCGVFNPGT